MEQTNIMRIALVIYCLLWITVFNYQIMYELYCLLISNYIIALAVFKFTSKLTFNNMFSINSAIKIDRRIKTYENKSTESFKNPDLKIEIYSEYNPTLLSVHLSSLYQYRLINTKQFNILKKKAYEISNAHYQLNKAKPIKRVLNKEQYKKYNNNPREYERNLINDNIHYNAAVEKQKQFLKELDIPIWQYLNPCIRLN